MTFSPHGLAIALPLLAIVLLYYRRFRRQFGRQPVQPRRMTTRIVILVVIGIAVLFASSLHPLTLAADLGGMAIGVALGFAGLRLTRFERHVDGLHYIPHSWFGVGISALLLARLGYRFAVLWPAMQGAQHAAAGAPMMPLQRSPLTLGLFGLLIGYYVCYYAGVLWIRRKQPAAAHS